MEAHVHAGRTSSRSAYRLPFWLGVVAFLGIGLFFLLTEHRAHTLGALPYVLLLLCPALHLFMHRGHRAHSRAEHGAAADDRVRERP